MRFELPVESLSTNPSFFYIKYFVTYGLFKDAVPGGEVI
jgi:hypothetical protein